MKLQKIAESKLGLKATVPAASEVKELEKQIKYY